MVNRDSRLCALCGVRPATTNEHVPSKSLFKSPRPNDLITVPACSPCNSGTQPDDDYFRKTLALIDEPTPSDALELIRPAVTRSFQRPREQGLRAHFESRLKFAPLSGRTVHQPVIQLDSKRLNNVVAKHAAGVFYEVTRRPLSPTYGTFVLPVRWFEKIIPEDRPHWQQVVWMALRGYRRQVGDGSVFKFAINVAVDDPNGFVAVLLYFENFAYAIRSFARQTHASAT